MALAVVPAQQAKAAKEETPGKEGMKASPVHPARTATSRPLGPMASQPMVLEILVRMVASTSFNRASAITSQALAREGAGNRHGRVNGTSYTGTRTVARRPPALLSQTLIPRAVLRRTINIGRVVPALGSSTITISAANYCITTLGFQPRSHGLTIETEVSLKSATLRGDTDEAVDDRRRGMTPDEPSIEGGS